VKLAWWLVLGFMLAMGVNLPAVSANPDVAIGWNERHLKVSLSGGEVAWRSDVVHSKVLPANGEIQLQLMVPRASLGEISSQNAALWLQRSLMAHWPTRVLSMAGGYNLKLLAPEPNQRLPWEAAPTYLPWLPGQQPRVLVVTFPRDETVVLRDASIVVNPGPNPVKVAKTTFRGQIVLNPNRREMLTSVNVLSMEDYLRGVVPNEMPAAWSLEALKAQALAARTYAVRQRGRHEADGFDLCSTIHCQAYGALTSEHPRSSQAVVETRGEIILHGNIVIDAVYHAHAGGQTRNSEHVWGGVTPYLKGVSIPEEPVMTWTRRITWNEFTERLRARGLRAHYPYQVAVHNLVDAGHVGSVRINSASGEAFVPAGEMRAALDRTLMRSTKFSVRELDDLLLPFSAPLYQPAFSYEVGNFAGLYHVLLPRQPSFVEFIGQGHGHGVGMSQWGAFGLARDGYNYRDIIKRFYTGVRIARMW